MVLNKLKFPVCLFWCDVIKVFNAKGLFTMEHGRMVSHLAVKTAKTS